MTSCKLSYFQGLSSTGFHKVVYNDWGREKDPIVVCVHGLTCNKHDFDYLAPALVKKGYRVIAVDIAGRGDSDYLDNPADYNFQKYLADLSALLAHLNVTNPQSIDWIGTSMGGLLGMVLAASQNSPIKRLVLNDVGPFIEYGVLEELGEFVFKDHDFECLEELKKSFRKKRAQWGPITDEQWAHLFEYNHRVLTNDGFAFAYDPAIGDVFKQAASAPIDLRVFWHQIKCPTLVLRGTESKILPASKAREMQEQHPDMTLVEWERMGHAPSLMADDQIKVITDWLS